jgi:3-oxoacyl-[acyl-carrier-protein] synthase I
MRDVRLTGLGVVSTLGTGVNALVGGLRGGKATPTPLDAFPLPTVPEARVSQVDRRRFPGDKAGVDAMALAALREALAGAVREPTPGDCALVCGGNNAAALAEQAYRRVLGGELPARPPERNPGDLGTWLAHELGIGGPVLTINTACSSSANALLIASDLIVRGRVRRALVLGVENLNALSLAGFQSLMLLDPQGCRPFDVGRRGLQLGEGAAALLLERGDDTAQRGWRLRGGANLCDIHHVTSANPDGSGMALCMTQALARAGCRREDIVAVKAHATGSAENDAAEVAAMRSVFGNRIPPFTALKRYVGHTLGACGAIETVAMLAALRDGFIPVSAGFVHEDPELGAAPVMQALASGPGDYLLNYFGFGGNYASLVVTHG